MVSKASDDLPEPESPVITVSDPRGIASVMSLRLCSRAPEMTSFSTTSSLEARTDVPVRAFPPTAGKSALDGRVDLVDQRRPVGQLEVLLQIAVDLIARGAVQRHVERDQACAFDVIPALGGRLLSLGLGLGLERLLLGGGLIGHRRSVLVELI